MSAGKELESLTEEIFRRLTSNPAESGQVSVERNVMLEGADGPRQIDIVLRSKVGPIELVTIIECKDYKRTVIVTTVDALESVLHDVGANKAILVSRGGFSKTAMRKAKRLGIGLYRANQVSNVEDIAFQVPVHVREIKPASFDISGALFLEAGTTILRDAMLTLNDSDMPALLRDDLLTLSEELSAGSADALIGGRHVWNPTKLSPPWFIRDDAGNPLYFEELKISYVVEERHFFGYLSDLPTALYLRDELADRETILFKSEDFVVNYEEVFSRFDRAEDLPAAPALTTTLVSIPEGEGMVKDPHWSVRYFGEDE